MVIPQMGTRAEVKQAYYIHYGTGTYRLAVETTELVRLVITYIKIKECVIIISLALQFSLLGLGLYP